MNIKERNRKIVGIFQKAEGAQKAIEDLHDLGYETDDISVVSRVIDDDRKDIEDMETLNETSWNHGARPGGAVGGVSGLLAALGQLELPGLGSVMAAGPIKDTLMGSQIGGKSVGAPDLTIGHLICGPDAPEGDADFVEKRFEAGDIFISVDAEEDRFVQVAEVLGDDKRSG